MWLRKVFNKHNTQLIRVTLNILSEVSYYHIISLNYRITISKAHDNPPLRGAWSDPFGGRASRPRRSLNSPSFISGH